MHVSTARLLARSPGHRLRLAGRESAREPWQLQEVQRIRECGARTNASVCRLKRRHNQPAVSLRCADVITAMLQ